MHRSKERASHAPALTPLCRPADMTLTQDEEKLVLELEKNRFKSFFSGLNRKGRGKKERKTSKKYLRVRMVRISQLAFHSKAVTACEATG